MQRHLVFIFLTVIYFLVGCGGPKLSISKTQGQESAVTDRTDKNPLLVDPNATPDPTANPAPSPSVSPTPSPAPSRPASSANDQEILNYVYGENLSAADIGCGTYLSAGYNTSRSYLVGTYGAPEPTYCEQQLEGGGWSMVFNSVASTNGQQFFNIPYADRLGRKGTPTLQTNFYDGEMNTRGTRFMDVIEDKNGAVRVLMVADSAGINPDTMVFQSPVFVSGQQDIYGSQFAAGWASTDHDGDQWILSCASYYGSVTQHYSHCWNYNLGADGDVGSLDGLKAPHIYYTFLNTLGLAGDGTIYSVVRRITRYVKW